MSTIVKLQDDCGKDHLGNKHEYAICMSAAELALFQKIVYGDHHIGASVDFYHEATCRDVDHVNREDLHAFIRGIMMRVPEHVDVGESAFNLMNNIKVRD